MLLFAVPRPIVPGYGAAALRPGVPTGARVPTAPSAFEATLLEDDDLSNDPKTGRKRDKVCFVTEFA